MVARLDRGGFAVDEPSLRIHTTTNMAKHTSSNPKTSAGSAASDPSADLLEGSRHTFLKLTGASIALAGMVLPNSARKKGKPSKAGAEARRGGESAQDEANLRDAAFIHAAHAAVDRQVYSDMDIAEKFILRHYGAWVKVAPSIDVDRLLERVYVTLTGVATLIGGSVPMDIRRKGTGTIRATVLATDARPAVALRWLAPGNKSLHERDRLGDLGGLVVESAEAFANFQDDSAAAIADSFIADVLSGAAPCPLVGCGLRRVDASTLELAWDSGEFRVSSEDLAAAREAIDTVRTEQARPQVAKIGATMADTETVIESLAAETLRAAAR